MKKCPKSQIFWSNGKENFQVYHIWESKFWSYASASKVTRTCFFLPQGIFGNAVEILKPLRYKILQIGGSNAQVSGCFVRLAFLLLRRQCFTGKYTTR